VRFLLDNDIDAAVGRMLRQRSHQCWTASAVGLAVAADDALTVWASSHSAALVSTDREFGQRRMRNSVGHHVWLRCPDWEACDLLSIHLDDVTSRLQARSNLTIRVSKDGLSDSSDWR
jgi:predicted nuclease of predicted toxin-antitoxin system